MSLLLRRLATGRVATEPVRFRYNPEKQISEVFEDRCWVASWMSRTIQQTKKCDHETGEDEKGT